MGQENSHRSWDNTDINKNMLCKKKLNGLVEHKQGPRKELSDIL